MAAAFNRVAKNRPSPAKGAKTSFSASMPDIESGCSLRQLCPGRIGTAPVVTRKDEAAVDRPFAALHCIMRRGNIIQQTIESWVKG